MALPLQTWQHKDPKGLWPALGGLAVLTHIGVIGMSVPYLLSLRETSEQNAATAIPIELSVIPATDSKRAGTSTGENSEPAVEESQPVVEPATTANSRRPSLGAPAAQPLRSSADVDTKVGSSVRSPTSQPATPKSSPAEPPLTPERISQPDNTSAQATPTDDEVSKAIEGAKTTEAAERQEDETLDETSEDSSELANTSPEGSPPTIGEIEGEPLPDPAANSRVDQSLRIRIVGDLQLAPVKGVETDEPPKLIDTGNAEQAEGCGKVSEQAIQVTLVYRISVRLDDGTIERATLQDNQYIESDSDDDRVVACLIEKIGIQFRPTALSESDQQKDDSWLMTFELSEQ